MTIGGAIKQVRKAKGLSQGDMALAVGLSQTAISQIESGLKQPREATIKKICKFLKVPETLLHLYRLEEKDVSESKKETFRLLYPFIKSMLEKMLT